MRSYGCKMDLNMVLFNKYEKQKKVCSFNPISHGKFKQRVKKHFQDTCQCCPGYIKDKLGAVPLLIDRKQKNKCKDEVKNVLKMLDQIVITDPVGKNGYSYKCFVCKDQFDTYDLLQKHVSDNQCKIDAYDDTEVE